MEKTKKFRVSSCFWPKREFDPASAADLSLYQKFLNDSKWANGCPFIPEWPFTTVTDTIKDKLVRHHIGRLVTAAKK